MRGPLTVKLHTCPDTESQPAQPPKFDPFGFAVSEIVVPGAKLPVQVEEQEMCIRDSTIIVKASSSLPLKVTANTGNVALRVPMAQIPLAVVQAAKIPITARCV